jgi:GTP-binding protein HflX
LSDTAVNDTAPALLVGVDFGGPHFDGELLELGLLAETAGLRPVARLTCKRRAPDAALFVGSGKADEIKFLAQQHGATEVLFDQSLSPAQQRNLERHIGLPVNDRTLIILEIFGQRARSHEGKLQVELARLQYLSTRLVRRWSHLERQRGGIGTRGGPGETQIELDRRMISESIKRTKERLTKVKKQRHTQRKQRDRRNAFTISLVGYTNAGKSSLLNRLTKAGVLVENALFATLDPTVRKTLTPDGREYTLADTVGFVRNLPHQLVEAFRSTLEEIADSDLVVHIVDASHPDPAGQIATVRDVIGEVGARDIPELIVFNKIDLVDDVQRMALRGLEPNSIAVSARSGEGIVELEQLIASLLPEPNVSVALVIPYNRGDLVSRMHMNSRITKLEYEDDGTHVEAMVSPEFAAELAAFNRK